MDKALRLSRADAARAALTGLAVVLSGLGLAAATTTPAAAQSGPWDANTDFSLAANPNGPWSYLLNGVPLANPTVGYGTTGIDAWDSNKPVPDAVAVMQNETSNPITIGNTVTITPGFLTMDPEGDTVSVAFTPPVSGSYTIQGQFNGADTTGNAHPVGIVSNGVVLWEDSIASFGQASSFNLTLSLTAGTPVEFAVETGSAGCSYCYLATGFDAAVTLADSPLAAAVLPGGRSVELPDPATVFATVLNTGSVALENCQVSVQGSPGMAVDYQTTDPATNALTGRLDTPVTIAANGSATFLLSFQASAALSVTAYPIAFSCDGAAPATITPFVNTIDLTFSTTPIADIIALAATPSNDGILTVPQAGSAAFAVAVDNAGSGDTLTATADTGTASLPLALALCETDPATGQCQSAPTASLPVTIAGGDTATFSVFATASGQIPLAPGTSRIFVRFLDSGGNSHGSTSVAVQTQ